MADAEEKQQEPEKVAPKIFLKQPLITAGLSQIGKTHGMRLTRRF